MSQTIQSFVYINLFTASQIISFEIRESCSLYVQIHTFIVVFKCFFLHSILSKTILLSWSSWLIDWRQTSSTILWQRGPWSNIDQVGRVFANGPGDLGSIPVHVIQKTLKMVLGTSLLSTQQFKIRVKSKVD